MRAPPPPRWPRFALLLLGMLALAAGLLTGLARLAWPLPLAQHAPWHGPLMLCGLFGVVIGLERAVAVGGRWPYLAPLACGAGTLLLLTGHAAPAIFWAYALGFALLLASTGRAALRQGEAFMAVLLLGAFCGLLGCVLLALGAPLAETLLLLWSFLVLTIAGERLELSRYLPRPRWAAPAFAGVLLALLGSLALPMHWQAQAFGASLLLLAAWLAHFDLARRTLRAQGLTRFVAVALLAGYLQLALAGLLMLAFGLQAGTRAYDGALHALGLGFVFSMVLGHAPLIAPALLRVRLRFSALLYLPLALLHASVLLRLGALALDDFTLRRLGGLGSAAALALFLLLMLFSGLRRPTP